jgi:chorismate synthase
MSSTFGHRFRIHTFGESHGGGVGVVVDGCPSLLPIELEEIQAELDRRRPGQSDLTTPRSEADKVEILSGLWEGKTLGSPIALMVRNQDAKPSSYEPFKDVYRPSHADFTYQEKYGIRAWAGGGRSSARETIGRVAAGAIAKKFLRLTAGIEIVAWVQQVQDIQAEVDSDTVTQAMVDAHITRCPDPATAELMAERIRLVKADGDSVGGVIQAVARNVPTGLGEPIFNKLEADLAAAMMSLPATKGFEIGSGFAGTLLRGSQHNDAFVVKGDKVGTSSNRSGGIQGGISNGEPILLRVAFKPTSTIFKTQDTVNQEGQATTLQAQGRHDPCVLPRAVVIVEAMMALVLADHMVAPTVQYRPS